MLNSFTSMAPGPMRRWGLLLLPIALASASCTRETLQQSAQPSDALVGVNDASVPVSLQTLESRAEDAYDHALANDRAATAADVTAIRAAWGQFRDESRPPGASDDLIAAVNGDVEVLTNATNKNLDGVEVARAANALSAAMPDLFSFYATPAPSTLLRLDYLGRSVVLDARTNDFALAHSDLQSATDAFSEVRPMLVELGALELVQRYDAALSDQQSAIGTHSSDALRKAANAGLELVDAMEQRFIE